MKAIVGGEADNYLLSEDVDIPRPKPGTMLCRVHAVALNPLDHKIIDFFNVPGALGGSDFAGTVVELGEGVQRFKKGDRILGVTFGSNAADKTAGAFAEYILAIEDLSCLVPEAMSFEQACSMGLAIATSGLALFQAPGLELREPETSVTESLSETFVLVSGGATATGTMATQLLSLAGYTPIVTCSPANNALCESYGAKACFDYNLPTCGADIREYTGNSLSNVMDCVTDAATMKMCYEAIGSSGGSYIALEPASAAVKYTRRDVRADWLMAHSILGTPLELRGNFGRPRIPEHRKFGAHWFSLIEKILGEGKIKNHPLEVREGGLASMPEIIANLRTDGVRAKKLIVPLVLAQ